MKMIGADWYYYRKEGKPALIIIEFPIDIQETLDSPNSKWPHLYPIDKTPFILNPLFYL